MIGKILAVYINGVQMVQVSDDKFASGNPGIGFYLAGATGVIGDFGFSSFMATDRMGPRRNPQPGRQQP
jgi:hypothetical protein